jgi:hypothetical protein
MIQLVAREPAAYVQLFSRLIPRDDLDAGCGHEAVRRTVASTVGTLARWSAPAK